MKLLDANLKNCRFSDFLRDRQNSKSQRCLQWFWSSIQAVGWVEMREHLNKLNFEHRTSNVQHRIRNFVNLKKEQEGRTEPITFVRLAGVESAELFPECSLANLIDQAQRHQYWAFKVGRSMFICFFFDLPGRFLGRRSVGGGTSETFFTSSVFCYGLSAINLAFLQRI